jgi:ParB-like chromosome segregation protein Spo0J
MAKPKSRVASAAIASMLGVQPSTSAVTTPDPSNAPPSDMARAGEGAHPVRDRSEAGVARADNALVLDPRRIARRGRYVRPFTEDRRFRDLMVAIAEAGHKIHVPVLVRVEGPPGAVEYVLVDGTHRLEAALRLNIPVPAVNLGRITTEQAFAIQAMANEVRSSTHVVDQAAYVLTLLGQGLTRETVQRTTGFSAGRVSELSRIGTLLAALTDEERAQARRTATITHRALRALATGATAANFHRKIRELIDAARGANDLDSFGEEIESAADDNDATDPSRSSNANLVSRGHQVPRQKSPGTRRGRAPLGAGGVTFAVGRNARGTSITFRMAWRARGVQADPELFIERVRDALQAVAAEATAHYDHAMRRGSNQRRRGRAKPWRDLIAREEAELGTRVADRPAEPPELSREGEPRADGPIPDPENPMPMPPSRRRPGDQSGGISPRLLAGLSLPMLAERLKRRPPDFQQLDTHITDIERQAEEARQRARESLERRAPGEMRQARHDKDETSA